MSVIDIQKELARYYSKKNYLVCRECGLPTTEWSNYLQEEVPVKYSVRRADFVAINTKKEIVIVETKSSKQDFNTDKKWKEYLKSCNKFYFASDESLAPYILEKLKEENMHKIVGVIAYTPNSYDKLFFLNNAKKRDCDCFEDVLLKVAYRLSPYRYGTLVENNCFK